jgi:conjugative transfer signal peptidase TraF
MTTHLKTLVTMQGAAMLVAFGSWIHPAPQLIWNASASVPIGLYAVDPPRAPKVADLVVVTPPAPLAQFLASRGYLPTGVPMLKHIGAVWGQTVCRYGHKVRIDGDPVGEALAKDRLGRPLPVWQGCLTLSAGQVFLFNAGVRDSFDGRYFGVISTRQILGQAHPIWIRTGR